MQREDHAGTRVGDIVQARWTLRFLDPRGCRAGCPATGRARESREKRELACFCMMHEIMMIRKVGAFCGARRR